MKIYDLNEYREKKAGRISSDDGVLKKSPAGSFLPAGEVNLPQSFTPQLPTLISRIPDGKEWLNEVKFDGYRMIARIHRGDVRLITRRGNEWTDKYEHIAQELSALPIENGIIDGELVVQNPDGTTNFERLQNYRKGDPLVYYVFDIPYLNGRDLSQVPLIDRKSILHDLVQSHQAQVPSVRYSTHTIGSGLLIFEAACRHKAEGIVSKRIDSPYIQGRSTQWVKTKCIRKQEFIVIGYTEGNRAFFGSLLLGYYDGKNKLTYCGNVGTGFNSRNMGRIHAGLIRLEGDFPDHPVVHDPLRRKIHWVSPDMVVEVKYSDITGSGIIRHAVFLGVREDKDPKDVTLESGYRA